MSITCGQRIVSGTGISGPSGTPKHAWLYDENHGRIKETRTIASGTYAGTRVTWALHADKMGGLDFESEVNSPTNPSAANPAVTSNRHYLSAGGQVIGVLVTTGALPTLAAGDTAPPVLTSTNAVKLEYWHKDHLGSTAATTDHASALTARYAYDPFGKRRATNGSYDAAGAIVVDWSPAVNNGNDRGFTGHEHLDDVGLVHMNGRVFDPRLGVFLQADPMTQDPYNLQGFNRYGYCLNNPLTCTDPSGLSFWTQHRAMIIGLAVAIVAPQAIGWILTQGALGSAFVTLSYGVFDGAVTGLSALGNFTVAAVSGFASGAVASGNLEGGVQGAFTAAMFYGAGDLINGTGAFAGSAGVSDKFAQVAIHGVVGCVTSEVGGGKCGPGAASAAFSKFATVNGFVGKDVVSGTITSAVIGGTAAELGGGKFANGAQTAAFGYLFNGWFHQNDEWVWKDDCTCSRVANAVGRFVSDFLNAPSQFVDWIFSTEAPPLPDSLVGVQDGKSGQQGNRWNSGPLAPTSGGTGDAGKDFDRLTGGTGQPAPANSGWPAGTQVGENGVAIRPSPSGPRIDIPSNGKKPHETLHYPK